MSVMWLRMLPLSAALSLLLGCAPHGAQWPAREMADEVLRPTGEQPLIAMERRGCFGTCPAYRVEAFADGRVSYFGIGYVATHGERDYRVDPENVRRAVELLSSTSFRTDPEKVDGGQPDGLVLYLFSARPRPKLVLYQRMQPELQDVIDAAREIDVLLATERWVLPHQSDP